jgi:hypothetical protein
MKETLTWKLLLAALIPIALYSYLVSCLLYAIGWPSSSQGIFPFDGFLLLLSVPYSIGISLLGYLGLRRSGSAALAAILLFICVPLISTAAVHLTILLLLSLFEASAFLGPG